MKINLIVPLICIAITLTGCSKKNFDNAVKQGNDSLAKKEYTKAEASFRLALAEKNDDEIFKLNEQTNNIISILEYIEDKELDKALKLCKEIEDQGFANDLIKKDIQDIKIEAGKEVDKVKLQNDIDKKELSTNSKNISKDKEVNTEKDPIEKAKDAIYSARGLSSNKVKLNYYPSSDLGTIISNDIKNKYYVFGVENKSDGTEWDSYLIVDKNSYNVLDMDMYGNVQGNQVSTIKESVAVSNNQIEGGISSKKALDIIETAYASRFIYTGEYGLNGVISDEAIYNPNTETEGYAYLFAFREIGTGTEYIGEVYKDGEYRLLCNEY